MKLVGDLVGAITKRRASRFATATQGEAFAVGKGITVFVHKRYQFRVGVVHAYTTIVKNFKCYFFQKISIYQMELGQVFDTLEKAALKVP